MAVLRGRQWGNFWWSSLDTFEARFHQRLGLRDWVLEKVMISV